MLQKSFLRANTGALILGLPRIRLLWQLYQKTGSRPTVVARRFPLPFALIPFARLVRSSARGYSDILAMELADLAARNEGRCMRLIPVTEEAYQFVRSHQTALEASYVIEWTFIEQGDSAL